MSTHPPEIKLGTRRVGPAHPVYIVAELACAHQGEFNFAERWIDAAADANADAVKFQAFTADGLVVPGHKLYDNYKAWEFGPGQWPALAEHARKRNLDVLIDVFEPYSLSIAQAVSADGLKVHSTNVTNPMFLERVASLAIPVLIGTGGTTEAEIRAAVEVISNRGTPYAMMHGFQAYPTSDADTHLRRTKTLSGDFACPVGFAGHAAGDSEAAISQNLVALGLGCSILESHLTLDRSPDRADYHSSLLPDRFAQMVAAVRSMETSLGSGSYDLGAAEANYRTTFKAYIVASRDLPAGHTLVPTDFNFKRADTGLLPSEAQRILGQALVRNVPKDTPITPEDVASSNL